MTGRAVIAVAVVVVLAVSSAAAYELYYAAPVSCQPVRPGEALKSQLPETRFGGVTEYALPPPVRLPDAITNASDGSVWFAEQEVPGVAHFFPANGTLVEYAWPGYAVPKPPECSSAINVSGIAIWGGRVWGANQYDNVIVGLNPRDGSVVDVNSTGAPYPYWLAAGPGGDLWFTSDNYPGQPTVLGRILPNLTLEVVKLAGLGNNQPIQLDFVNSSFALLSTIDQASTSSGACVCTGHVYSFDPTLAGSTVAPAQVGGNHTLIVPNSVAYLNGSVWITQHSASAVARYDFATGAWTQYPTSLAPFVGTTLPYFVQTEGGMVWFNEHVANKIAELNPRQGTLTEYSEANPPIDNGNQIQNDIAISPGPGGLWFTSMTGNYIGFVSYSYSPGFAIAASGGNTAAVAPGGSAGFSLRVSGSWSRPMGVNVSDSEDFEAIPRSIAISPSVGEIPQGVTAFDLGVRVSVGAAVTPGDYTLAVTVTDGDVQQTAYLFLDVT